jgi:hypothetical protein
MVSADSEGFAGHAACLDRDHRGKDTGKVRMQCTTGVRMVSAMVSVMMGLSCIPVIVAALMMALQRGRNWLRAGTR